MQPDISTRSWSRRKPGGRRSPKSWLMKPSGYRRPASHCWSISTMPARSSSTRRTRSWPTARTSTRLRAARSCGWCGGRKSDPLELQAREARVETVRGDEGGMGALLDHLAVVEHDDAVAGQHGRQPMRDHECG